MQFVSADEMRQLEAATFAAGLPEPELLALAGQAIASELLHLFPQPGRAIAFIGKGHNAADALVCLRHLHSHGWQVALIPSFPTHALAPLTRQHLTLLGPTPPAESLLSGPGHLLVLDALVGLAHQGPLRPPLDHAARHINHLRQHSAAIIVAIDLPSGLNPTTGVPTPDTPVADFTLCLGRPKLGQLSHQAIAHCGRLVPVLLPLHDALALPASTPVLFEPRAFPHLFLRRSHHFHKGLAGRLSIVAGSPAYAGAALLTAHAALASGTGLITLHTTPDTVPFLTGRLHPEIMLRSHPRPLEEVWLFPADARIIGPGLGPHPGPDPDPLTSRPSQDPTPLVIDADALNRIASLGTSFPILANDILTPHPGEFRRLAPHLTSLPALEAATTLASQLSATVLLKGARTIVASPPFAPRINPTGHAGMASGGQGDTLSGVIGALLAQGLTPVDAASYAAWLCGRSAELALAHSPWTSASSVIHHLGHAFYDASANRLPPPFPEDNSAKTS